MGKRPTIQMVANHAGVSRGTVDRVLNHRSYVREDVRVRVLQAVQELGYLSPHELHRQALGLTPLQLGVILPNWSGYTKSEFLRGIIAARAELQEAQVDVIIRECQTDIPGEVNEYLDDFTVQRISGIALCALNDLSIEHKIAELDKQGIPVITFNSDLPESRRLCFIGQDYVKSGRIAGELMSKIIPKTAHILALAGNLEFYGHRSRLDGFCARLSELGFASRQITVAETYNDYHVTYRKVLDALQHPNRPDAVYMANRSVAGCVEAIRTAGLVGKIRVISHDVTKDTKALLKKGEVDLTISQDIYRQGYLPLILLRDLLRKGKQPVCEDNNTAISIICAENML